MEKRRERQLEPMSCRRKTEDPITRDMNNDFQVGKLFLAERPSYETRILTQ